MTKEPGRRPEGAEAKVIEAARIQKINDVRIQDLLAVDRVEVNCQISSKKRLMEKIATLLLQRQPQLDRKTVLQTLIERERLGSTGIGQGVALPHGRINGLDDVIGAVAVLERPLDYDAIDRQPVQLAFGLLVPAEANEQHLKILAHLARMFSDDSLRQAAFGAASREQAFHLLANWDG